MSIKFKIPLVAAAMLVLNLVLLYLLAEFVFSPQITNELASIKQSLEAEIKDLASDTDGMSYADARAVYEQRAGDNFYRLVIKKNSDLSEDVLDYSTNDNNILEAGANVVLGGELYLLTVAKGMDNRMIGRIDVVQQIFILESAFIVAVFSVLILFIFATNVRPLKRLDGLINSYIKRDSGKKRKLKDEIAIIENSFYELTDSLEKERDLQTKIIASISHDIKTPLTSVLGYSERLISKDFDEEKRKSYLETIHKQALNIESILEEFDDYIMNKQESVTGMKEYKLSYIRQMLIEEYADYLKDRGIEFSVNDNSFYGKIKIDIKKMRRVFANIISNSIKHSGVPDLRIEVTLSSDEIDFKDNGKGVAEDILDNIFVPFFTSDFDRDISGLGLSICKSIMLAHGGDIEAKNLRDGFLIKLIFNNAHAQQLLG